VFEIVGLPRPAKVVSAGRPPGRQRRLIEAGFFEGC